MKSHRIFFLSIFGTIFAVLLSNSAFGQVEQEEKNGGKLKKEIREQKKQEKEKQLEGYELVANKLNRYFVDSVHVYLTRRDIEALQPDDLGELLLKLPGVNVKSYGGLGGLKTVSIRGLGGQHTNFVFDGFSQTQTQTGQVNLGQIQLDNVEAVVVQRGGSSELEVPVSAQLSGNAIILESFLATTPKQKIQFKTNEKIGSFGQIETYNALKVGGEKLFVGGFIKFRQAEGDYPFRNKNYKTIYSGRRHNNDFKDQNAGLNLQYNPSDKHQFNVFGTYLKTAQGVPGAIVLYNDFSVQRLDTDNAQLKIDYRLKGQKMKLRIHYLTMRDSLFYFDPAYLNNKGVLLSDYTNNVHDAGISTGLILSKKLAFNAGIQTLYSTLTSGEFLYATPKRQHFLSFAKASYEQGKWNVVGQIGWQYVDEQNETGAKAKNLSRANPYVEVKYHLSEKILLMTYYRNSFRMPNFNELYYNNIGNSNLNPEDAHQLAFSSSLTFIDRPSFYAGCQLGAYYHMIDNMILTIPTKNLFVWSIQNVGKNEVRGADAIGSISWKISPQWNVQLVGNYTFQQSLNVSDKKSPSYRHQVAYHPVHVFNGDITLQFNQTGMRFSLFGCSERYMLNQNIPANRMDGFMTMDWSIFHRLELASKHAISFQFVLKNIADESYSFVRSFIMPHRHFIFSISYAFT